METRSLSGNRSAIAVGALLIIFGGLALLANFVPGITALTWAGLFVIGGVVSGGIYLIDRTQRWALIPAYAMLVIAAIIWMATTNFVIGEAIGSFVLFAIAAPFLYVFLRNTRENWWALIPAYVLASIGAMILLMEFAIINDAAIATYVLTSIAVPFVVVYALKPREHWWALIPAYAMLVIAAMVYLIENNILSDLAIASYVMFAIAMPFFVVYIANRENWWALIPGGIMGFMGLGFSLGAAESMNYVMPIALIAGGILLLAGPLLRHNRPQLAATGPEADKPNSAQPIASEKERATTE